MLRKDYLFIVTLTAQLLVISSHANDEHLVTLIDTDSLNYSLELHYAVKSMSSKVMECVSHKIHTAPAVGVAETLSSAPERLADEIVRIS